MGWERVHHKRMKQGPANPDAILKMGRVVSATHKLATSSENKVP